MQMNWADKLAWLLIVIGGLNWGLVGFFKYNLVNKIFSGDYTTTGSRIIYDLVGVAAVYSFCRMVMMMSAGNKKA